MESSDVDRKTAFGKVLREAREATGLSQESFAHAVEMDRTTISLLERGKQSPTVETLWKLSAYLDVAPSALLGRLERSVGKPGRPSGESAGPRSPRVGTRRSAKR